jgi:hypothetical protein
VSQRYLKGSIALTTNLGIAQLHPIPAWMASCNAYRVALLGMSSRRQITGLIPLSSIRSWNVLFESIAMSLSCRSSLVRIIPSSRQYLGLHSVVFTTKTATHRTGERLLSSSPALNRRSADTAIGS